MVSPFFPATAANFNFVSLTWFFICNLLITRYAGKRHLRCYHYLWFLELVLHASWKLA